MQQPLRVVRLVEAQRRRRSDASRRLRELASALPALGTRVVVFSGGEPLLRPEVFDAAAMFREQGMTLHLLTSGVLLERFAGRVAQQFSRVIVSLDAADERLYEDIRGVDALEVVRRGVAKLRDLAPDVPVTARATLHRLNFRELPRLVDHAKSMALDGISFLPADMSSSGFGRAPVRDGRPNHELAELALDRDEIREFEAIVEYTIERYARDFASGFIAEAPDKLRRLPRYYAAAAGDEPFPRVSCNAPWVSAVIEADGSVRPCFFQRADRQPAADAVRDHRHTQPAGVPAVAGRRREPGLRALRLLAEDVVEAIAVASMMLFDTQRAFDGVAAGYDQSNAANPTLCHMRAHAREAVQKLVPRGSHVIDLGCGPGTDAEYLAQNGYRVTAIDWSRAMVDEARRRLAGVGLGDRVDVLHAGIHEIEQLAPVQFDAAYSNFGPLNCVDDLAAAAHLIGRRLRPGGVLIASVIGRVCPWEIALYLARGRWWRAAIRFRRDAVPVPLEGRTVWTRYYTPAAFTRIFVDRRLHAGVAPHARPVRAAAVPRGLCRPPPAPGWRAAAPRRSRRRLAGRARVGRSLPDRAQKAMTVVETTWMPRLACPECRAELGIPADDHISCSGVPSRVRAPRRRLALPDAGTRRSVSIRSCSSSAPSASVRDAGHRRPSTTSGCRRSPPTIRTPATGRSGARAITTCCVTCSPAVRCRCTCSMSAPAARGCAIVSLPSATTPSRLTQSTTRSTAWARRAITRPRSRSCRPTSMRCRSRRVSSSLIVFNGSLHYATDVAATLASAHRLLAPGGAIAVMDSPMFRADRDGAAMVEDTVRRLVVDCGLSEVVMPGHGLPDVLAPCRDRCAAGAAARVRAVARPAALAAAPAAVAGEAGARAGRVRPVGGAVIVLFNPLSTSPGKQPLPLSLMSLAAMLEARGDAWTLVDGNLAADAAAEIIAQLRIVPRTQVSLLAVTVMPGPQLTQAVEVCRRVRRELPAVPIVWGGYFPTQHTETVLRAPYVDFVIRSQGERSLLQLVDVLRSGGILNSVGGLSWKGSGAAEDVPGREQPGAAADRARRAARAAVSPRRHGTVPPSQLPGTAHGCAQLVVRLSVRVQLLRGGGDVEPPLARAVARAHGDGDGSPRDDLSRRRGADARHGLLHLRGADGGIRRTHRRPRAAVVGARPRRYADAVQRRDLGQDGALRPDDGVLRRRVGNRRRRWR